MHNFLNFLHPNFFFYSLLGIYILQEGGNGYMRKTKESFNLIIQSMFYSTTFSFYLFTSSYSSYTTSSTTLMLLLFFSHAHEEQKKLCLFFMAWIFPSSYLFAMLFACVSFLSLTHSLTHPLYFALLQRLLTDGLYCIR